MKYSLGSNETKNRKNTSTVTEVWVSFDFPLTFKQKEIDHLAEKICKFGIGDWACVEPVSSQNKTKKQAGSEVIHKPFPILQITDIDTGIIYQISATKLLDAVGKAVIDFPHALNTEAGYTIVVDNLTGEDLDEIVQTACFGKLRYGYVWNKQAEESRMQGQLQSWTQMKQKGKCL